MGIDRTNVGVLWFEDDVGHAGIVVGRQTTCMHKQIDFGDVTDTGTRTRFNQYVTAAGVSKAQFESHVATDMSTAEKAVWDGLPSDAQDDAWHAFAAHYTKGWTL